MFYAYVLESSASPAARYIGHTTDLRHRLQDHNAGRCHSTAQRGAWRLKLYVAFETLERAQRFERYLKSGSGHAFAKRHLW
jgi:putative endonuclease